MAVSHAGEIIIGGCSKLKNAELQDVVEIGIPDL